MSAPSASPWFPPPPNLATPIRESAGEKSRHTLLFFLMSVWVFFLPLQFQGATLNLAPSDLVLALALVLGLGRLRFVAGAWSPFHAGLVLAFLLGALISISENGVVTQYVQIKVIGLIALFAGYLCITSATLAWGDVRSLMRTFVLATTLHVLIALIAYAAGLSVPGLNYGTERLSGFLIDPNAFGGLVMVALTLQLVTQEGGGALVKGVPGMAVSATLALGLALTLSRTAWIGFGFALTVTVFYRRRLAAAWAVLVVVGIAGAWLLRENEDRSLSLVTRQNTAMQRVDQIRSALPLFSASPILGAGMGVFAQRVTDPTGFATIIHNTTVWIMTELGLVGVSAFLAFVLWFFLQGIAALKVCRPEYKPVILALMSAHAGMLGVSTGIEALYQRHWWFSMALLASCCAIVRSEAQREARNEDRRKGPGEAWREASQRITIGAPQIP